MKRHALFVGVNNYADPSIQNLAFPSEDATELASVFRRLLKFDKVEKLINPAHSPDVEDAVEGMAQGLGPGDLFLFFFAGHGFRVKENHVLVCAKDKYAKLEDEYAGLPVGLLKKIMRGPWNRMLVLDACQNDIRATRGVDCGAATRDLELIHALDDGAPGAGFQIVITSCSEGQKALEVSDLKHGLFTSALLDSVTSFADSRRRIDLEGLRTDLGARMGDLIVRYRLDGRQQPMFTMPTDAGGIILLDGVVRSDSQSSSPPVHPSFAAPTLVVCPVCGKKNHPEDTFRCRKCGRDNLCLRHQDEATFLCAECTAAQRNAMECKQKAESAIRNKYDQLKRAGAPFGDPLETGIWRTPDGGWQCNYKNSKYDSKCAITLRPGDDEAYGVYGGIWEKWDAEGGVYNERKERGRLGYPVSDEEPYYQTSGRVSCFENGVIVWRKAKGAHVVMVPGSIFAKFQGKYNELIKKPHSYWIKHLPIGNISHESDGGWQQRFGDWAAILLRPGDTEPHEVHGAIYKRWSEEGGVFGHLGYPVSDEEIYSGDGDVKDRVSHFEHGDIVWKAKENRIHVGRTITLYGNTKMELVWCPPGEFMMGSPESEEGRYDGETQHRVRLTKGFWLGKYPVTQRQWQSVMGSTPSEFKGDDLPVETVSWDDCQAFIKKVNAALECGARLPTEAEWEYACRAGTTTAYSWGNALNGDRANCDGNYPCGTAKKGPYLEKTTPVGKYGANPWGLCDMHGNVWEWCADWRGDYPSGSVVDPTGPASGGNRVLRGGDWSSCARDCRSAIRNCNLPDSRDRGYGFRLCCSAGPRG